MSFLVADKSYSLSIVSWVQVIRIFGLSRASVPVILSVISFVKSIDWGPLENPNILSKVTGILFPARYAGAVLVAPVSFCCAVADRKWDANSIKISFLIRGVKFL